MESITNLLDLVKSNNNCIVKEKAILPLFFNQLVLPKDLLFFYESCGGRALFSGEPCELEIVAPQEFQRANPIIVGENYADDISYHWFIIGKGLNSQYITIDLSENSLGYCYDSFWDRHGIVGENTIIAKSFTEMLDKLLAKKGEIWYWLDTDFEYIGDAYGN